MLVLTSWLKEFIPACDIPVEELAARLTLAGLEVEGVEPAYPWLQRAVAARITKVRPHPEGKGLTICTIDAGTSGQAEVVCGAPNVKEGMISAYAPPGTLLPDGQEVLDAKVHGVASKGMLCSGYELAVGDSHEGVMELDEGVAPGTSLEKALDLEDFVLEIGITPNRADCLSVLGVAREASAVLDVELEMKVYDPVVPAQKEAVPVPIIIEKPDLCRRYAGAVLKGVTIGSSPHWLRRRLVACSVRPINNVVDINNYILLERGQPLHAFDLSKLHGPEIRVRCARQGERIETLDGKERELSLEMLVIADADRPVAVAGIMGGANSEVDANTTDILLESAWFEPSQVRRTAKALKLSTEASYRFERGIDPEGVVPSLECAASLIQKLGGAVLAAPIVDEYPAPYKPRKVAIRPWRANRLLGIDLDAGSIASLISKVGIKLTGQDKEKIEGLAPSFRMDLVEEIDLVEEVARLYGFQNIPTKLPRAEIGALPPKKMWQLKNRVRQLLNGNSFKESISYSFISPGDIAALKLPEDDPRNKAVKIMNPLTEEQSVMRTHILPSLLLAASRNQARRNLDLALFEMGKVFLATGKGKLPREEERLCAILSGARFPLSWSWPKEEADFFDLKGAVEEMLAALGVKDVRFELSTPDDPYYAPGTSVRITTGSKIAGTLGEIALDVLKAFDVSGPMYGMDLSLETLKDFFTTEKEFRQLPRYPAAERDAAIIVDADIPAVQLLDFIEEEGVKFLEHVTIFDLYQGKPIPKGKKSVGIRFRYRALDHTLTEEEINAVHEPLIERLLKSFGGELRK